MWMWYVNGAFVVRLCVIAFEHFLFYFQFDLNYNDLGYILILMGGSGTVW